MLFASFKCQIWIPGQIKRKKLLEPIIISSPKSIVVATCYFLGSYVFKCSISYAEMSGICRFQSGCNCSLSRCTIIQIIDKYHYIPSQKMLWIIDVQMYLYSCVLFEQLHSCVISYYCISITYIVYKEAL